MSTASKPLKDLLELVDASDLVLPEIQRDFVWSKRSVLMLFDSLYRGLPIGHMLVWKTKVDVTSREFSHRPKGAARNFYGYLLDGQQRLTAISKVRDRDDEYPLLFSLWPDDEERPALNRFAWSSKSLTTNPWYIQVADALDPAFSALQVLERLKQADDFDSKEHGDKVWASLNKLQSVLGYHIGVTEFDSSNHRDATELFVRFNSTGTRLAKTDLAMAELALVVPRIVSDGMGKLATQYPGFQFTRHFLVQALVAVHTGRLNLRKPGEIWGDGQRESEIRKSWQKTAKAIGEAVEIVTGTIHWDSHVWLPSLNALIPLIYALANSPKLSLAQRRLVRKWLCLTGVHRYFSGSGHGELDRVLRKLHADSSVDKLWAVTRGSLPKLKPEDFDVNHRSGPIMSLYVSMLRDRGARDWVRRTNLGGTVIGHNAGLEVHHFFPRALLSRRGVAPNRINTFANYTIICKHTNVQISAEDPVTYVAELKVRPSDLEDQCVPAERQLWAGTRYEDFLLARRKLLADRANAYLA